MEHLGVDLLERLQTAPGAEIVLPAVADEPVYVVGGAVRDVLLGAVARELDLVVEGDAIAVAHRAAARVGGELTVHERFGTATVRAGGYEFDVASARRETYARPGALPDVQLGATLEEDLARRDFTVNAMAVRLADGMRISWPSADQDLAARRLRVLHERSFEDDPTRMLRMVRYAARLGFTADAPVEPALLRTVTGDRAGRELRLALDEPQPQALQLLAALGLARELFGDGFEVPPYAPRGPLGLAAACVGVQDLAAKLDVLAFAARERDIIVAAATNFERLAAAAPASDADLYQLFRRQRPETAELLAAAGHAGARRWLENVRHRRLQITGDDLIAEGLTGAQVGAGLERATVAMLDGDAPDRATQLASATYESEGA